MKSKLTITVASILSVLTLVGVGFAAWVIMNPSVSADQNGTITAETVSDKSYTLEAKIDGGEIVFGKPATPNAEITTPWLTADSSAQTEHLSATLTLTLKYKDWAYVPLNFTVTMNAKKDNAADTVFTSLRDGSYSTLTGTLEGKNFIANPKISYRSGSDTITNDVEMNGATSTVTIPKIAFPNYDDKNTTDEKTTTLVVTITFGWGTYFTVDGSVVNPYTFYNKKTYDKVIGTEANTVLTAISGLKDVSYTVTISGTTNTPNVSGK